MRRLYFFSIVLAISFLATLHIGEVAVATPSGAQLSAPAQQNPPTTAPPTPQGPGESRSAPLVVLDPAHGGTDSGARGAPGVVEKDLVLHFARVARLELERGGFRVLMTRSDDSEPSYDDRDAIANSHRDAIFISLHVSSTGPIGTVRAYSYPAVATAPDAPPPAGALVAWDSAQQPFTATSHRLADFLQVEFARGFNGSPQVSNVAAVRELRSVAGPAAAVEISSVSGSDANALMALAAPLATAVVRGVVAYRVAVATGSD